MRRTHIFLGYKVTNLILVYLHIRSFEGGLILLKILSPFKYSLSKMLAGYRKKLDIPLTRTTTRGMTPGSDFMSCIVWVFPNEVTP